MNKLFYFKGRNAQDMMVEGKINAVNEVQVVNHLKQENIVPVTIRSVRLFARVYGFIIFLLRFFIPVSKTTLATTYYQLAGMLSVDIPLKSALQVIANHMMNRKLAYALYDVEQQLVRGISFSNALLKFKRIFTNTVIQLVALAKSRTELISVLKYADMSLQRANLWRKALFILLPSFTFFALFVGLMMFLKERYIKDFHYAIAVFNKKVPGIIVYFQKFTDLVSMDLLWIAASIIAGIFLLHVLMSLVSKIRVLYHAVLYYAPVLGSFIRAQERERLALMMHNMLSGGTTTQKCWEYGIRVINNQYFKRKAQAVLAMLQAGESFSFALSKQKIFGSAELQLIVLAEASDSLCGTFQRVYEINRLLMKKRIAELIEALRISMLLINLVTFLMLVVITETIFFYPGS